MDLSVFGISYFLHGMLNRSLALSSIMELSSFYFLIETAVARYLSGLW
jgi:hypothetical protein